MSDDKEQKVRLEHLYELRRGILDEMEEADRELGGNFGVEGPSREERQQSFRMPLVEGSERLRPSSRQRDQLGVVKLPVRKPLAWHPPRTMPRTRFL